MAASNQIAKAWRRKRFRYYAHMFDFAETKVITFCDERGYRLDFENFDNGYRSELRMNMPSGAVRELKLIINIKEN